jgi:ABC-type nitrate/sulfonate/bicarbonate transport system substrate-binding protein
LETLRLINSGGVLTAPYIAWGIREGCFEKHGLEIVPIENAEQGSDKVAALIGGNADIASDSLPEIITAISNADFPAQLIAGGYEHDEEMLEQALNPELVDGGLALEFVLLAGPGVTYSDVSNLIGSRVGTPAGRGPSTLAVERLIKSAGFELEDVEFIELAPSERLVALQRGDIQFANIGGAQVFEALEAGASIALYPGAYIYQPSAIITWFTSKDLAAERPEEMAAFQRAVIEIHTLLQDENNLQNFKDFLANDFGLEDSIIRRFTLPPLVTRELTVSEFEYWIPILIDEGIIPEGSGLPADLIFKAQQ